MKLLDHHRDESTWLERAADFIAGDHHPLESMMALVALLGLLYVLFLVASVAWR